MLSFIVPAYNEEAAISNQIDAITASATRGAPDGFPIARAIDAAERIQRASGATVLGAQRRGEPGCAQPEQRSGNTRSDDLGNRRRKIRYARETNGEIRIPVARNGEVVVRSIMNITMSCEHRAIDGATGAKFLQTFKQMLENPILMLM